MKKIKLFLDYIRCIRNRKEFDKYSVHGEDLVVRYTSHCKSNDKNNITIGNGCEIKGKLLSYGNGKISIGDNLFMSFNSIIGSMESVTIGNDVIISTDVRIFDNNNHPVSPEARIKMSHGDFYGELWTWKYAEHKSIIIEDNVWIGEYAAILKGVKIGKGSIVASHSVVTKDVPEYVIVAGNPAKVVKKINMEENNE